MIEFTVTGMTCGGCVRSVERAIDRVEPGIAPNVDLATGRVRIPSDKPADGFRKAIEAAGYEVAG
ncbi:heavy-metal-associated domain-containing protein [Methylobrevis pamukkalensis]|uniref:Heavy-metal-associated domain protein n=1 Tax=Methylobrevis pamukkalensis TaxID=1439726 RepID=A0A1E3H7H7_9HYPH|nr:heavy metal-associated domain-containing protein [Methylobrevis pamukkalensis]ODN71726.1 Heavy-metal-associated domain protein [Methylobrevis pamukkalensis]